MDDDRLNGSHLNIARRDQYDATIDELLDERGPATSDADPLVRLPRIPSKSVRRESPAAGGTYTLVSLADGRRHPLRVGINALGRYSENDIVLRPIYISRRHCVIVVHATGGCEVYDTASLHGIRVNRRRVGRTDLRPGDVLELCSLRFMVAWVGPEGELLPYDEAPETSCTSKLSSTGEDTD